jgi:hypothetical protein
MVCSKPVRGAMLAALFAASPISALAAESIATVGAGAEYLSGKYGGTLKTDIL